MASTGTPATRRSLILGMRVNLDCRATTTSRKVCGGALWCTIHQSGGSWAKGYGPPLFSCLLNRRVQNRQTLRYLKSPSYQDIPGHQPGMLIRVGPAVSTIKAGTPSTKRTPAAAWWCSAGRGYSKSMSRSRGQAHLVGKFRVHSSNLLGGVPLLGRSPRGVGEGIQSIQRIERAAGHASGAIFLHVDEVSPI